jgi:tetratricopeptide (TPR) repeat protein
MRKLLLLACLASTLHSACAPKTVPLPVVTAPRFPDFMKPAVPAALAGSPIAQYHERAWTFLQAGDLQRADSEISAALKTDPGFFTADIDAAYVALARKDPQAAVGRFDRALRRQPADVPALVGKGLALSALDRSAEALEAFQAALASDPSLSDIGRRVEVLKFRGLERSVAEARRAAQAGRTEEAVHAYRAAIGSSPESAFLYREVAEVERQRGELDAALADFRKALEIEPSDSSSQARIAEVLEARGDLTGAIDAYTAALAIAPDPQLEARREAIRTRIELANLPEEYRAIETTPRLTRGGLAALVGVRLGPWLQRLDQGDVEVMTDIRSHWAERWILDVARAGVLDPFANHTFQPRAEVRKSDLAQLARRLLTRAGMVPQTRLASWQEARLSFPDVPAAHVAYPAASFAVSCGVLAREPNGSFQPSRVVTGQEGAAAVDRLRALMEPPSGQRPVRQ